MVESTHGSLRRPAVSAADGISDYRVTPTGVQWERRVAWAPNAANAFMIKE